MRHRSASKAGDPRINSYRERSGVCVSVGEARAVAFDDVLLLSGVMGATVCF
jgi:hypothetical protein